MLLLLSWTDVVDARRRDLKELCIKPSTKYADKKRGFQTSQLHSEMSIIKAKLLLEMLLAVIVIAVPLSVHAGILPNFFQTDQVASSTTTVSVTDSASEVPLLSAQQNPDPMAGRGGAELLVEDLALVSVGPIGPDEIAASQMPTGEISVYTVREGDSLSQIAEMFGVTTNTIMWANDIARTTGIRPGQTLVILPIAGVRHVVKQGDTIASIASKYEGNMEEILSYNQLDSAADIAIGDTLIIPGGAMQAPAPARVTASQPVRSSGNATSVGFAHPAPGSVKTQGIHGYNAVDLAGPVGTPIRAAAAGQVIVARSSGWNGGYGNYIVIRHSNGVQTLYAHLSTLSVGVGEYVAQAQNIGGMGNTGRSTGPHLHFEVRGGRNPF